MACAEVLVASEAGGSRARNVFVGLGIGAVYKFFIGFLHLWNERVYLAIPRFKKAVAGIETTPALLGVGYILGYRIAAVMVAGSLVSWVALIPLIAHFGEGFSMPLFPETTRTIAEMTPAEIWTRYIRYIGAGAVAFGGIVTVLRSMPTMVQLFGHRGGSGQAERGVCPEGADGTRCFNFLCVGESGSDSGDDCTGAAHYRKCDFLREDQ